MVSVAWEANCFGAGGCDLIYVAFAGAGTFYSVDELGEVQGLLDGPDGFMLAARK